MTTEQVSVPSEIIDGLKLIAGTDGAECASPRAKAAELLAILSRATPSDVKVPEKLQFNAGDSPFIVQRKEGWNDCIEKMIGSDSQRFSLDQSFVDRVTQGDDESPDVIGAGCADSIKRVAEEMVHACKAVLQGDAEFTHDAVDDWAHRIMCFADYVPRKPSAPRVVTDKPSFERWYWSQIQNPLATAYNNPLGIPTDGNLYDAAKWGWDACRKSFATSLPAARVPDGEVRLWDTQWMSIVNHDNCYRDWSKDDAIAHAVKMTEQAIARNVADGKLPPKKTAAAPQAGERG